MTSITVPKIFLQGWFWAVLLLGILFLVYVVKKREPAATPKSNTIFVKHRKLIRKLEDVLIICILLFNVTLFMCVAIPLAIDNIFNPPPEPEVRAAHLQTTWALFLMAAICPLGLSGALAGLLSIFQSNLTKLKRVILLIICLLPVVLTVWALQLEFSREYKLVKLGLLSSFACWIVNGPAVLAGKPFFEVIGTLIKKALLRT